MSRYSSMWAADSSSVGSQTVEGYGEDQPTTPQFSNWVLPQSDPEVCPQKCGVLLHRDAVQVCSKEYNLTFFKSIYHSLLGVCWPCKFNVFLTRLQLTAMHYNENAERAHASTTAGELRYSIVYPKYKHGDFTVRPLRTHPTSGHLLGQQGHHDRFWRKCVTTLFYLYTF